jgi:hypothetical protein
VSRKWETCNGRRGRECRSNLKRGNFWGSSARVGIGGVERMYVCLTHLLVGYCLVGERTHSDSDNVEFLFIDGRFDLIYAFVSSFR